MGCESTSTDHGPTHDCVSVAGVWDINMVGDAGPGIVCPNRNLVWTLLQSGCDVTIEGESWDSANGAVTDNRLYAEWTWFQDCYRYHASLDVTVDGGTMNGTYYLGRTQAVYPAYCPGLGICSATLNGVRRAAAR
jgi:hypothetical protein